MGKLANEYFHDIFSADYSLDASPVLELLESMVSDEDNVKLCAPFTDKEILDALFQIGPPKAPGPDASWMHFHSRYSPPYVLPHVRSEP